MSQIQIERGPGFSFESDEEKGMHFKKAEHKINEFKKDLKERFYIHYRGEIKYDDLYNEINSMLDEGKKIPDVKKIVMEAESYKDILNENDLLDLFTDVVIKRQAEHEKENYHYEDKEKSVAS